MVGQYFGKLLLDQGKVYPDPRFIQFADFHLDLNLKSVPMGFFAFSPVVF
jgi:hypothetical protein